MNKLIDFYYQHADQILIVLFGLYEIGVRLWPTYKNWSIIDFILKALPNRRKTLPVIIFLLSAFASFGQLNGNFKSVRLTVNDTTTTAPINGTIIYNTPTQAFYVYENFGWVKMVTDGPSGNVLTGANNGLTAADDTVYLGGTLNQNTAILTGNNAFSIESNTTSLSLDENKILVTSSAPGFPGIEYATNYSASATALSLPPKAYIDSHIGGRDLSATIPVNENFLRYNSSLAQWTPVDLINGINTELQSVDANGLLQSTGVLIPSTGNIDLGLSTDGNNFRTIKATGSLANIGLQLFGKGNTSGSVLLSANGSANSSISLSPTSASVTYNAAGAQANLFTIQNGTNNIQFRFSSDASSCTLSSGHTTGGSVQRTFAISSTGSNTNNINGDNITITAGNGSNTVGHTATAGGNITITGGTGGTATANSGGNVTISGGPGGGGGSRGNVLIPNLPTSSAGLPSGALWNNAGVLNIVP